MANDQPLQQENIAFLPVLQNSGWSNPFISLRETILNRLAGAGPSLVINKEPPSHPSSASNEPAVAIQNMVVDLKGPVINADGSGVDYTAMRESDIYKEYRKTFLGPLREFDPQDLPSQDAARAFWINLYNTLIFDAVIHFDIEESVIEGRLGILTFFRRAAYIVGGEWVSLDDMEQGILRGNRGHPYLPGAHFATHDPRRKWALPLDPRIHFALNCGGLSCPPIRAYTEKDLNQQLDLATRNFLHSTVDVRAAGQEVALSTILRWYKDDFGGRAGLLRLLTVYLPDGDLRRNLVAAGEDVRFVYTDYDWRLNAV